MLSTEQRDRLLLPLDRSRVEARDGFSYLNVSDVRRWLIRIFGFGGFSYSVSEAELISHTEATNSKGKINQVVSWKVKVALEVPALSAHYESYAIGTSQQPSLGDAHDMAIKTAESDALKRCCVNLGDQFGLSLYFSKGREGCFSSVMRVMVDGTDLDISEDVQAAPEASSARHEEATDADGDAIVIDLETGEVTESEPKAPRRRAAKKAEPESVEIDPETERALEVVNQAGLIAPPEDFWACMTEIRSNGDQQKRLKAATAYKLSLMKQGLRGDALVITPTGSTITLDKAFDVALAGQ